MKKHREPGAAHRDYGGPKFEACRKDGWEAIFPCAGTVFEMGEAAAFFDHAREEKVRNFPVGERMTTVNQCLRTEVAFAPIDFL